MSGLKKRWAFLCAKVYMREERYIFAPPEVPPGQQATDVEGFETVRVDASNGALIDQWDGIRDSFRPAFRKMLAEGEIGYFFLDGNTVASHVWLQINRGTEPIHRGYLRVYPGESYTHFAHTYPDYRRRNLAHMLATQLLLAQADLEAMGIHTLKASVAVTNTPSLALMRSVGGRIVGKTRHWRILGKSIYRVELNDLGKAMPDVRW